MKRSAIIKWMYGATRSIHKSIALSAVFRVLSIACSLVFVYSSKELIDIVTKNSSSSIKHAICIFIGSILTQIFLSTLASRLDTKNVIFLRNKLRERLFESTLLARWDEGKSRHSGDLTNRLIEDVRVLCNAICLEVPNSLSTGIQIIAAFIFLLFLEARLAWTLLFVMPLALLLSRLFASQLRKLTHSIRSIDAQVQSHIQESIQNHQQIKALDNAPYKQRELNDLQGDLQNKEQQRLRFTLSSRTLVQLGFAAGYSTAFLWGIFGIREGAVSFGMMTAFLQLVSQIQRPAVELSHSLPSFIHAYASAERLSEINYMPQEEQGEGLRIPGSLGVYFRDVTFKYAQNEREILSNANFCFESGKLTALVGETGAGKSTIIKLILALIHPTSGSVLIKSDKTGEEHLTSPLTRCNISYVPQGNSLLSGSIRENLLLGNAEASDDDIARALKIAVADFVYSLPEGLETLCGERGVGLSEGQAQRIAIARGLLRESSILLLDEPSSALDCETEALLLMRLKQELKNKCIVMISHQQSAIALADCLIEIKRN